MSGRAFLGNEGIGFEEGKPVLITQAEVYEEAAKEQVFEHLNPRELASKFVDILVWIQEPNMLATKLRKIAVVNRLMGIGPDSNSSWQQIADANGCGRACISRLCSEFQKRFGVNKLGPVKLKSKQSCKEARLKVIAKNKKGGRNA